MKSPDANHERVPAYLERYAAELDEIRQATATARKTSHPFAIDMRIHSKDRALLVRVESALVEYDRTNGP